LSGTTALAKRGTIGIYAIVDNVACELNEESPERVRIWGTCVVPEPMSSGLYNAPQRVNVEFKLAPGLSQVVRQRVRELEDVIVPGRYFGFGQYWVHYPADLFGNPHHSLEIHIHQDGDVAVPDDYPLSHSRGIVKTGDPSDPDFEKIAAELTRAARY